MSNVFWGLFAAFLILVLLSGGLVHRRGLFRARQLVLPLIQRYFRGDIPLVQLRQRLREAASRRFLQSAAFHSIVVAGFQNAAEARLANRPFSKEDEIDLLKLLAELKEDYGLTDRYQIEAWRAGRE